MSKGMKKTYPVFRVEARMDDTVHVKVEIIVFEIVRVRFTSINRDLDALDFDSLFLDDVRHYQRVLLR